MRAWTRGERIAFFGTLIGGVTCVAVLSTVPGLRQLVGGSGAPATAPAGGGDEAALLEQQRKLLAEQGLSVKEQMRQLYEQRVALRKERIELIAERDRQGGKRSYDTLGLRSTCPFNVSVALHYKDLDDRWVTRGWWTIEPGKTVDTDAKTRYGMVYFYAENLQTGWVWTGDGREGALSRPIVDERFDALDDDPFLYENPRHVSFYPRNTGTTYVDHIEEIACAAEAPAEEAAAPNPTPAE